MENYGAAYYEVLQVLKYLPEEDYEKIPKKIIQLMEGNCNTNTDFTYNLALPLEKQNISKEAKTILAILYRNCWLQGDEKREFIKEEKEYIDKTEKIKREKYNPDEIFKEKVNNEDNKDNENHYLNVIKEESFFDKIVNKIKKIFRDRSDRT